MSKEQYEWIITMARLWGVAEESADLNPPPKMERIDGIAGRLAPNTREPSNDAGFSTAWPALVWLLLVADLRRALPPAFLAKSLHSSCKTKRKFIHSPRIPRYFFAFS